MDDKDGGNKLRHAYQLLITSQEGDFEMAVSAWFV